MRNWPDNWSAKETDQKHMDAPDTHLLLPSYAYLYLFYISLRVEAFDTMPRRRNVWIVAWNIDHLKLFDHVSIFGTFEKDKMASLLNNVENTSC